MKAVKFLIKFVIVVVIVAIAAVLALPLWIGPVAKSVVHSVGPGYTKTEVSLGDFALNPYTGNLRLGDLLVGNPEGFSPREAVKLNQFEVELDPMSLAGDVIHIRLVRLDGLFVSYVNANSRNNFEVLMENVGGKKDAQDPESQAAEAQENEKGKVKGEKVEKAKKPSKKVIIDRLELKGIMVQVGPLPLPVPPLTLNDIGRKSNGATLEEAWEQIMEAVMKSAGIFGAQLKGLHWKLNDSVKDLDKHAAKLTDATKNLSKSTTAAVTDTTKKVTEGATKTVADTTKSVTEGATKSVDAVGESAKKALDSLKSLW